MFGEIIEVKVGTGPSSQTFIVHKGAASFYSGYFEAAIKSNFKEGKEGVIELPTEDAQVFKLFVRWMCVRYTSRQTYRLGSANNWVAGTLARWCGHICISKQSRQ